VEYDFSVFRVFCPEDGGRNCIRQSLHCHPFLTLVQWNERKEFLAIWRADNWLLNASGVLALTFGQMTVLNIIVWDGNRDSRKIRYASGENRVDVWREQNKETVFTLSTSGFRLLGPQTMKTEATTQVNASCTNWLARSMERVSQRGSCTTVVWLVQVTSKNTNWISREQATSASSGFRIKQ
jgi:hypothetical protein